MASPSSSSNSTALTKRSADTALMPPPQQPPAKRIKRPPKIIDEDTYTNTIEHIVARDFYPGLLEMRAQREYMAAVESRDKAWINDAGRRLQDIMTPLPDGRRKFGRRGVSMTPTPVTPRLVGRAGETPRGWGGETPRTPATVAGKDDETEEERQAREEDEAKAREREEMRGMSLNAFQAKYTSEDNESFNALLDRQNTKRAAKHAFLWQGNKIATGRQIAYREREAKLLKADADEARGGASIRNNDRALVRRDPERERDGDTRKAMPDHRPSAPRNSLMFAPDSIEDTHETVAQAAQAASTAPPKAIVYTNTRLPAPPGADPAAAADNVPPSPSLSAVNAAIRGRPRPTESEVGGGGSAYAGNETPRVAGYAFVDEDDPEPEPDNSLLQRLGITAEAAGDGRPNPFSLRPASRREELHHKLVDKTSKAKREGGGGGGGVGMGRIAALKGEAGGGATGKTPTPKFASSPVMARKNGGGAGGGGGGGGVGRAARGNLTPAAQRLFARVGGATPRRDGLAGFGAFDGSSSPARRDGNREKVRWTPTPRVKRTTG